MGQTQTVELSNSYHDTHTTARARVLDIGDLYLSAGQVRRIRRDLCGHQGCTCGGELGELGERGPHAYEITPDYDTRRGVLLGAYLTPR